MDLLTSIAVAGAGVFILLASTCIVLALWRQGFGEERPVLIDRLLRSQGDRVAYQAIASGSHDFAVAVRRCIDCTEAAQCRAWLASGARDGYQSFCPNAAFVERTKRLSS